MKTIMAILIIAFSVNNVIFSQDLHLVELQVTNTSSTDVIKVEVIPVGVVFEADKKYKLRAKNPIQSSSYIYGGFLNTRLLQNYRVNFTHDATSNNSTSDHGIIGYGKYRVNFYKEFGVNFELVNHCYVDFSHSAYPWSGGYLGNDISLQYINENTIYHWDYPMPPDNTVKIWDQRIRGNPLAYEEQNKDGFISSIPDSYGNWLQYPQDPLTWSGSGIEIGKLMVNLVIEPSHHPKVTCGETFSIESGSRLILQSTNDGTNYAQFTVNEFPVSNCGAVFINRSGGSVFLLRNTQFIVENGGKLYLENNSSVTINNLGAAVRLKTGSYYCNQGATIVGGRLYIDRGVQYCIPDPPARVNNYVSDSASIILETGADFIIPDSTTYIFEGPQSAFMISDSTTVKFGKNSKLVFQDGARINANGCKFVSYDSTDVWDGIYLDGIAYDTLKNCTFQNAVNGINITNNYDPFGSPGAVEISNCTFKNSTNSDLLNYVYVNNSYNVLI